jgi:predicted Zn-dependent protease
MKPSWRTTVFLLFGFQLTCVLIASAQQYGEIAGELHVIRGDFPGRVMVELELHSAPIAARYTDEQGKFAFGSLTNNQYHVVVRDERFYAVDVRVNLDLSISSISVIQINLMPKPAPGSKDTLAAQRGNNPYIVDLQEYRRNFPKKAVKEFEKGLQSDGESKRDDAMKHYGKALEIAPNFYPAHNNLGSDYLAKADFPAALTEFQQAIKLNQSDAQAHLNLANVFLQTKRYEDALHSVEEGLRREPNSAFGKFLLGAIYERLGKRTEAEKALHEALALDPAMAKVHLELVNLYLTEHKRQQAETELQAFLKDFPNDPLAPKAREVLYRLQSSKQ